MTAIADETVTDLRWVPAGERIVVGQRRLDDGAVYVGEHEEPSALDTTLPVHRQRPDWQAATAQRPPRYAELTPEARAAYLVWLETGRRAPQAPSLWALLYLYGLERRVFLDGDDDPAHQQEAHELDAVYGHDEDVHRLATTFAPRDDTLPALADSDDVPDALRREVGRRALTSTPIDADRALAWAWFHPAIPRRAAATTAPERFAERWKQAFDEAHPGGLVVPPRRRRLTVEHVPTNPSLPAPLKITVPDASDVFDAPGPERLLRSVTERVESDLEQHVRWLQRHPGDEDSAAALGTMPHSLIATSTSATTVQPLVAWAEEALGDDQRRTVRGRDVVERWSTAQSRSSTGRSDAAGPDASRSDTSGPDTTRSDTSGPGTSRSDAMDLARVLDQYGVGIEPDPRFGGSPIDVDHPAVLFRFERPPVTSPSPAYTTALVTLELCAAVATADGTPDDAEDALLVEQVGRVEDLVDAERARLAAHRDLLRTRSVDLADVSDRIGALDGAQRQRLGDYLVEVARVDGEVSDAERATLTAVHELLGLRVPDLDHRPGGIDTRRLAATRTSNAEVQRLLADIFADDEEHEEPEPPEAPQPAFPGLDRRYTRLLRDLAGVGSWTRAQLEQAARRHGVMPDGALDAINEAAIDATEEHVIEVEDDESVTLDADVYREMTA